MIAASMDPLSDAEFLAAFEDGTLEPFHHRDHVRMTWLYLRAHGEEGAEPRVAEGIQRFAVAKGAVGMFHVTLTRAWLRLVSAALRATPEGDFAAFAAAHADLIDKNRIYRHYSKETIGSPDARAEWVEPDLLPLP
jgi:sigma54-dependent transcription regulator